MTVTVASTSNTQTFSYWLNRTNELANAMSTVVVTTTDTTTGNAAITGAYISNTVFSNTIIVGNSSVNTSFSSPNTVQIASGDYFLNANGKWTAVITPVTSSSTSTSGTSAQQIDSYAMADYGGVEFFIRVKDNVGNNYFATKVLSFHNTVNAFSTEYGAMYSNTVHGSMGSFTVNTNATHVLLWMTPTTSSTNVSISRVNF